MEQVPDSPYMTTAELAALLRTTPGAVRIMRHRGIGPRGFRRGRNVLYLRTTVAAWLKAKEAGDRLGQRAAA
ncbi:helix-turn-helix domain-containing protein [Streptomyces sp. NPDC101115]|uniref:helix-turn-helix domain-containing protein n=1 Tax=Streptomyces sp. NPDC101115 TaxID=3366106 RepID=UPI0037FFC164